MVQIARREQVVLGLAKNALDIAGIVLASSALHFKASRLLNSGEMIQQVDSSSAL